MIYKSRKIATLDLGTNSLLMLIAERDEEGRVTVIADESAMPRLGEGLRATKRLGDHIIERACRSIREFVLQAKELGVEEILITATSAVREAENSSALLTRIQEEAGIDIEVLPPNEEARLTYLSVTTEPGGDARSMVVDIGGGSTEVTWGIGHRFDGGRSLDVGTIKVLEGHLKSDPPSEAELDAARAEIDQRLSRVTPLGTLDHYYGTAGTFTHLASVDLQLKEYHPDKIAGHKLDQKTVNRWVDTLSRMTAKERLSLPGLDPRRADVILSGSLIIERLYPKFGNDVFEVYDRGIRFGKLFEKLRNFVPPVRFS